MSNVIPEKCPKCGSGVFYSGNAAQEFECFTLIIGGNVIQEGRLCVVAQRDKLAARVKELEEVLKPLVAMHTEHKELVDSGDGNGYSDAYYCFYKGQYEHWDKAVAALGGGEAMTSKIQQLIDLHSALLKQNPFCYFELAYTRRTEWMAWLCSNAQEIDPNRVVLACGQGSTAEEAADRALAHYCDRCGGGGEPAAKGDGVDVFVVDRVSVPRDWLMGVKKVDEGEGKL